MCLYIVFFFEAKSRLKPSLRSNLQVAYYIKVWRKSCTKEVIRLATSKCSPNVVANNVVLARSHATLPISKSWNQWCQLWSSMPPAPITPNFPSNSNREYGGFMLRNICCPTTFHTIASGDVINCGRPHLMPLSHQIVPSSSNPETIGAYVEK